MPAKATKAAKSAAGEPAEPGATPEPRKAKAVRSRPAPAAPDTGDRAGDDPQADELVPMNRAERRAKGRGKAVAQAPGGRGKVSGSHGPAHTWRNWANRRTG